MTNRPKNNEKSQLLSDQENESIFNVLGRGCQTLSTAVVQLYLAEPPNRQRWTRRCCAVVCFVKDNSKRSYFIRLYDAKSRQLLWEQEIYTQFKYKAPREYFHTFEAHDCQAGLNFASEDEAAKFKKVVEGKLMERLKKRMERKKQQGGAVSPPQASHPGMGTINVGTGPPPASANVTLGTKPALNTVKDTKKKDNKKGGKKKLTKEDISTPTDFRHVSHVGWDPNTGLDMKKLDPEMKALFEQIGIDEQSQMDEETIDFIYDFVDKHGGLNAVREDLARRQPPAAPSYSGNVPPPPPSSRAPPPANNRPPPAPARTQAAPPPPPHRGAPPPAPGRSGIGAPPPPPPDRTNMGAPPPPPMGRHPAAPPPHLPSRDAGPPMRSGGGMPPPPPPSNIPAPPPPPAAPAAPPPPPMGGPPSGRAGLLDSIHKGTTLKHVDPGSGVAPASDARGSLLNQIRIGATLKPVDHTVSSPPVQEPASGIVGALAAALAQRKTAIQGSDDDDDDSDDIDDEDDDEWDD